MDERNDNQILFEEVLNVWLEDVRQTHAISTYVKYTRIVKKHIQPYFKDVPLTQITPASLRQFSDDLKQLAQKSKEKKEAADKVWGEKKADFSMGDVYSHTMIQTAVMITNMTMKMAFRRGLIHEWNAVPCSRRKKRALVQVLSTEEQMKLEGYIKENWSQTGFGIYLCLYTGMRLGEICSKVGKYQYTRRISNRKLYCSAIIHRTGKRKQQIHVVCNSSKKRNIHEKNSLSLLPGSGFRTNIKSSSKRQLSPEIKI